MNPQNQRDPYTPPPRPNPDDDYKAASQATAEEDEYDNYMSKGRSYTAPAHGSHKLLTILLVLILLAGAGYGAYWYLNRNNNKKPAAKTTNSSQTQSANLITTETKHYSSEQFNLEFDYPTDWVVTDTTGSGVLTARSPVLKLKNVSGKPINGQVLLTIRDKSQPLPEFNEGNAVAVVPSVKINYTKPSQAQRGSTYISFLQYAKTTATGALDGIYVTGDVGYQKGQAVPKADITPIDPVIDVTFVQCGNSACSSGSSPAVSVTSDMWNDSQFAQPITKMLQSLTIN